MCFLFTIRNEWGGGAYSSRCCRKTKTRHCQEHPLTLPLCLMCGLKQRREACLVARHSYLVITSAAIDGSIILRQEWNLGLRATFSANNGVHFSWSALCSSTCPRRTAARCTAGRTTARLIHESFLLVELLLSGGENEIVAALTAF